MSTEGSVSTSGSGIRQFGLYRTIDARTEEFLRLSRKRQLRQGCACAAISTAVTVTIVIIMILIYEYSIIHESNSKISLKQNWLSLMNKSAEAIPFEAKLNKAKINLDPMYVQFLPLILKTLNKNKYFDKIIEDDSTQTPINDKVEYPEDLYTKNIFSDSSSWMRMPTSRLYTIEYKTSPIVYLKYPTRNIEHFTKRRRIRDYQRIMNYVDKMISDKVAFTSTIPMLKNSYSFHKKPAPTTYVSTTPMTKVVEYVTKKQTEYKTPKMKALKKPSTTTKNKPACRCPKRISQLLSKLIKCLQKIKPDFNGGEQMSACKENKLKANKSITEKQKYTSSKLRSEETMKHSDEIPNMVVTDFTNSNLEINKFNNNTEIRVPLTDTFDTPKIQLISTLKNYQTMMPNTISKTFYSVKPLNPQVDYTLSSIINLIKPQVISSEIQEDSKEKSYKITTKQFIEGTDANYYIPEGTTKPMSKEIFTKASSNTSETETDFNVKESNLKATTKSLLAFPTFIDTKYTDYYTTPDVVDNFKVLNVQNLELTQKAKLESNGNQPLISGDEEKNRKGETDPSLNPTYYTKKKYNDTWKILRKMGKLAFFLTKFQNSSLDFNEKLNNTKNIETMAEKENTDLNTPSVLSQSSTKSYLYLSENKPEEQMKNEDVTLEEETDNATFEENTIAEDNLKRLGNLLNKINVSEIFNSTLKKKTEKEKSKLNQNERTQIEKHTDTSCQYSKSMIPESKPSYLEIQRNDWKREDELQDYDNTVHNNYFSK